MEAVAYLRNRGVICYEAAVSGIEVPVELFVRQLCSSGLSWCWHAWPLVDPGRGAVETSSELRLLTWDGWEYLVEAYEETNEIGQFRHVVMVGADPESVAMLLEPSALRQIVTDFASKEEGPVRMAMIRPDEGYDLIYVPHRPVEEVRALLGAWGIGPNTITRTRRYPRSGLYWSLEAQFGIGRRRPWPGKGSIQTP